MTTDRRAGMDLCATPAVELARLIRSRELSAAELLTVVLARIDEVNPEVNALDPLAVVGPIARTAPDAALLLAAMCGSDPGLPLARA